MGDGSNASSTFENNTGSNIPVLDEMPILLQLDRIVCVVLGIPLNGVALVFLLYNLPESGHSGLFGAMAILFNYTTLSQFLVELAIYNLSKEERGEEIKHLLCKIFSVVVGCPYALLLTTLTLGTLDRYTALAHPQFYRNHISKTRICLGLLFIFTIIIGININTLTIKFNSIIR